MINGLWPTDQHMRQTNFDAIIPNSIICKKKQEDEKSDDQSYFLNYQSKKLTFIASSPFIILCSVNILCVVWMTNTKWI